MSAFTSAKIDRILALSPDLVLGFSDLQADIAAELVRNGVEVHVFNQRSLAEILRVIRTLGGMIGCEAKAAALAVRARGGARVDPRVRRAAVAPAARLLRGMGRAADLLHTLGLGADRHRGWRRCMPGARSAGARARSHHRRSARDPAARARSDLRLLVRQEVQPALGGCASRVGRGARGARRRAARGQVIDHSAARASGAHRWRARAASRHCRMGGGAGLSDHPSPVSRRSASWYFSPVRRITSAGRRGAGGRLSQSSVSR